MMGKSSNSLYWKCQVFGWLLASLYWGFAGYRGPGSRLDIAVLHLILDVVLYILITHLFRNFSRRHAWQQLPVKPLLVRIIPATLLLATCFLVVTVTKSYFMRKGFDVYMTTPFYYYARENWFAIFMAGLRLMSIWVLAYYFYHYTRREIRATEEAGRLALIVKEAQIDNLSSQLNPHFFFNSLNNIKALVIEKPEAARRAIDLLCDLLRTSLYQRDNGVISLRDELNLVEDYIELEKIRFEERLTVKIAVEKHLEACAVPVLCVQVLVENAIKHGIGARGGPGCITIEIRESGGWLLITVGNEGRLEEDVTTRGLGLKNLRERLRLQYNDDASLTLMETAGIISATICIPAE